MALRTIFLLFVACILASCASGPRDVIFVNSRVPVGGTRLAAEIHNGVRPFQDPSLGAHPCTWRMDGTVRLRGNVNGGLFDVREPNQVDNATLQAVMTHASGSGPINVEKIEIQLGRGLRVGQEIRTTNNVGVIHGTGGKWSSTGQYFRFHLEDVNTRVSPARCRGRFEFVARRAGDVRLLLIEGSFNLREFDEVVGFIP